MIVVSVFRPEVLPEYDGMTEAFEAWQFNPFQGMEILFVLSENQGGQVEQMILDFKRANHDWKFCVDRC